MASQTTARQTLVDATTGKKPRSVDRLRDWEYLERSVHRLICASGRFFPDWQDKVAVHRHVWEQAESVQRLRDRLSEFPGRESNLDQPVSPKLERLVNTVLEAPSHDDAVVGIYQLLANALIDSYSDYCAAAHPVHDAPTIAALQEAAHTKENMRLWLRDYRRRFTHNTDLAYVERIEARLHDCGDLKQAVILDDDQTPAAPVGVNSDFRLPRYPARPAGTQPKGDFRPYIHADFADSVETRRLFWCFGYMMEMNLAMDQLRWLYDGHFMPWGFTRDVSRHLWDESRHGDSGHSRLLDFGITLREIGFGSYDPAEPFDERPPLRPQATASGPEARPATGAAEPLSPAELYEQVFQIGMIAETGHFQVKREAYEDFKAGGDMESAEMMLFDIIDEQSHVQYAHAWLPVLAEHAGIDNTGYRDRAAKIRESKQQDARQRASDARALQRDAADPAWRLYRDLLERMRDQQPLSNALQCPSRSPLPM